MSDDRVTRIPRLRPVDEHVIRTNKDQASLPDTRRYDEPLLPDLSRFTTQQLRQQLAYLADEIEYDIRELDGVPADEIERELRSRPDSRRPLRSARRPAPVQIKDGQDDVQVPVFTYNGQENSRRITVGDGLNHPRYLPVVDTADGTVLSFAPADADLRFFPDTVLGVDTDGYQAILYTEPTARPRRPRSDDYRQVSRRPAPAKRPGKRENLFAEVSVWVLSLVAGLIIVANTIGLIDSVANPVTNGFTHGLLTFVLWAVTFVAAALVANGVIDFLIKLIRRLYRAAMEIETGR